MFHPKSKNRCSFFFLFLISSFLVGFIPGLRPGGFLKTPDPCAGQAIGGVCSNGEIYAGSFDGSSLAITPSHCVSASSCDGVGADTVKKIWAGTRQDTPTLLGQDADINGVGDNITVATAASQVIDGRVKHQDIVSQTTQYINTDSAAHFCEDMTFAGYNDWYLPSKTELAYLYCKADVGSHISTHPNEDPDCSGVGGKTSDLVDFAAGEYWSSTEGAVQGGGIQWAWKQSFADGLQSQGEKRQPSPGNNNSRDQFIRCLRRY